MQVSKQVAAMAACGLIAAGAFLGSHFSTDSIKGSVKTVIKDRIVTVTRTVKDKDGSIVVDERRVERVNRSQTVLAPLDKKDWIVGASYHLGTLVPIYGGSVHRRIVGDLYAGGSINSTGELTIGLLFTF